MCVSVETYDHIVFPDSVQSTESSILLLVLSRIGLAILLAEKHDYQKGIVDNG